MGSHWKGSDVLLVGACEGCSAGVMGKGAITGLSPGFTTRDPCDLGKSLNLPVPQFPHL